MNWPTPTSRKKVERCNATVNYLSQYYNNLASCMTPLISLMGKTKFYWTPLEEKAFRAIKQLAEQAAILTPIDINHPDPIFLFADASLVGTGSWIGQGPTIYTARPAAFHSRKFTSQQTSYPTHDQELLAIVDACKHFQHILLGNHFTIITDNSSLKTLLSKPTKLLNNRQTRWIEILSPFDFEILNIPSSKNIIADTLSRLHEKDPSPSPPNTSSSPSIISKMNDDQYPYLPDWDDLSDDEDETYQGHEFTDEEVVTAFANAVLSEHFSQYNNEAYEADEELEVEVQHGINLDKELELWSGNNPSSFLTEANDTTMEESSSTFPSEQPETISLEQVDLTSPSNWIHQIATATAQDPVLSQHLNNLNSPYNTSPYGLLSWFDESHQEYRTFIPEFKATHEGDQTSFREELMTSTHDLVRHLGYKKTYNRLANQFIWPNMTKDIQEYVKTCDSCQRNKESTQLPAGLLHQPDMPVMPGTHFSMDFIGPLPPSQWNGIWYDSIFVYKDRFNGWIEAWPTSTNATGKDIADLYFTHIFPQTGLPESIICD